MNTMQLLREPHRFKNGDLVSVYFRKYPTITYNGTIYGIYNKPFQRCIVNSPLIDYFYVTFDKNVYNKMLLRGWNILYNDKETIVGHIERNDDGEITKIYSQNELFGITESPICMENINAILIWRVAYNIIRRHEIPPIHSRL